LRVLKGHADPPRGAQRKEAALRSLSRTDLREKLVIETSRIEVEAALEKADALKSRTSKLRTLRDALETVKAETTSEDVQTRQIEWLQEAIAEIEGQR
jgi:hypothetical protein